MHEIFLGGKKSNLIQYLENIKNIKKLGLHTKKKKNNNDFTV